MSLALQAAETGLLVFGTLHTNSAAKAIDRLIDSFPAADRADPDRSGEALRGVVAQVLLRRKGGGRTPPSRSPVVAGPGQQHPRGKTHDLDAHSDGPKRRHGGA